MTTTSILPGLLGNFLFLGPLLWIQELIQNILTKAVTGDWGWIYPRSPHVWWSFQTMPSWGALAAVWFALNTQVFDKHPKAKSLKMPARLAIMAAVGWIIEYLNGFIQEASGSEGLQVWPGSPFRYVTLGCYLWWVQNGVTWLALNAALVAVGQSVAAHSSVHKPAADGPDHTEAVVGKARDFKTS